MKTLKKANPFVEVLDEKELRSIDGGDCLKYAKSRFWGAFPWGSVLPACAIARTLKKKSSSGGGYGTTWSYRR